MPPNALVDAGPVLAFGLPEYILQSLRYGVVSNYVVLASLTIVLYDWFITLEEEIRLVWPSQWSLAKVLFMLNRYMALADTLLYMYAEVVGGSSRFCTVSIQVSGYLFVIGGVACEAILMLRAWAVWGRARFVSIIISILLIIDFIVPIIVVRLYFIGMSNIRSPSRSLSGCFFTMPSRMIYVAYIVLIFTEIVLLTLLLIKTFESFRQSRTKVMVIMYRDGVLYFGTILLASLANLIAILAGPAQIYSFLIVLQRVIHSCFCTRVLLHIRSAYSKSIEYDDGPMLTSQNANWQFNLQDLQNLTARTEENIRFQEEDTAYDRSYMSFAREETSLEFGSKSTIYSPYSTNRLRAYSAQDYD